jgi:tetratricopeptide (TPR) repeat protein
MHRGSLVKFAWIAAFLATVCAAYANHFHNSFHFDDFHTIQNNLYLRSVVNIPSFFTDSSTFSNLPTHRVYRPILTTTLALDYLRGGGDPFAFHVSTFAMFLAYLGIAFTLFRRLLGEDYWAFAGVAVLGLHPVCAETVNYIVQRAEILSTMGVAGGLSLYLWKPAWRRFGLYLVPVVLALLSKPPALVFPVLLFVAIYFWESNRNAWKAFRSTMPSLAVCGGTAWLLSAMTAGTFAAGGASPALYRITQLPVALHYFLSYFAPFELSADSDWRALSGFGDPKALDGLLFVLAAAAIVYWTCTARRRDELRPVAFGLIWFFVALFPTSWMPLAEVANDHRMFFPFLGLTLAAMQSMKLLLPDRGAIRAACTVGFCAVAALEARATSHRNEVWRNEETLWRDVTVASPGNGRGLMNYGLTQMAKGRTEEALVYFERARVKLPAYFILEINLGISKGQLGRGPEAERHFRRALEIEPLRYEPHFYYARWLRSQGRGDEAFQHLSLAVSHNSNALDSRHLLMQVCAERRQWRRMESLARETLRLVPDDAASREFLRTAQAQGAAPDSGDTAEALLARSLEFYRNGHYEDCIRAARQALLVRPDFAEAFNNIAAAYNALERWDEGMQAADQALRFNPSFTLARNNRQWAAARKQASSSSAP